MTAAARVLGRGAVLLIVVLSTMFGTAAPASAHPTLLFTDPATGTAVPESPQTITLVFDEAVTAGPDALTLLDKVGRPIPLGTTSAAKDGHAVTARPAEALQPGSYVVRWRVTGSDGDLMEGEFRFAVGTAISGAGVAGGGGSILWSEAALRWLLFAGLAIAAGGVIAERLTTTAWTGSPALPPLRSWVVPAALVALAGVAGLSALLVADAGIDSLWRGRVGQILLVEAAGLGLAVGVAGTRRRAWAVAPLTLVVAAEGLRSHANVAEPGWGALLTGIHLAAVAVWVGALVHVVRAVFAWRRERPAVRAVLSGYVRLALWVFLLGVATGTVSALLLVPLSALVSTTYGQVLLVKLALVAAAAGLALTARLALRTRPRLRRARVLVRAESGVLVVVLAASAVLVSTPPAESQLAGPPPARGPVVPLGTLAGQVGVSVAASQGQLVVRLTSPRRGDYYAPQAEQDYALSGQLTAGPRDDVELDFRGCGEGCFVAAADWRDGDNVLTLRAEAESWRGGTVSLLVPWPVRPGADDLALAVQKLREAGQLTIYETVTSDTTIDAPDPAPLDLTGAFFVDQEPYAAGAAPVAVRISPDGQPVRLALGYPAASMNVLLTLDEQGRISEETLTDDTHLIQRRFVYPDSG